MRISVSLGRVTTACRLSLISVLLLQFVQDDVQLVETLCPQLLVGSDPVVDGLERLTVDPVHPLPSLITDLDQPYLLQHTEMLGHLRLGQAQEHHEVIDGSLAANKGVEDLASARTGHGVERIYCRRRP